LLIAAATSQASVIVNQVRIVPATSASPTNWDPNSSNANVANPSNTDYAQAGLNGVTFTGNPTGVTAGSISNLNNAPAAKNTGLTNNDDAGNSYIGPAAFTDIIINLNGSVDVRQFSGYPWHHTEQRTGQEYTLTAAMPPSSPRRPPLTAMQRRLATGGSTLQRWIPPT
jgi:hypothetical protein